MILWFGILSHTCLTAVKFLCICLGRILTCDHIITQPRLTPECSPFGIPFRTCLHQSRNATDLSKQRRNQKESFRRFMTLTSLDTDFSRASVELSFWAPTDRTYFVNDFSFVGDLCSRSRGSIALVVQVRQNLFTIKNHSNRKLMDSLVFPSSSDLAL